MLRKPSSTIYLLDGVTFSPSYTHILSFPSRTSQTEYMQGKAKYTLNDYSFVRHNNSLKIEKYIEDITDINYIMYKNKNKWYYCFITEKQYINDSVTELFLQTDVWQTYQFDITLGESYVLREHTFPNNFSLLDEGFNLGTEYKVYSKQNVYKKETIYLMIINTIKKPVIVEEVQKDEGGKVIGRFYQRDINDSDEDKNIQVEYKSVNEQVQTTFHKTPYPFLFAPLTSTQLGAYMKYLSSSQSIVGFVKCEKEPSYGLRSVAIPYLDDEGKPKELMVSVIDQPLYKNEFDELTKEGELILPSHLHEKTDVFNPLSNEAFDYYPYSYSLLTDYINAPLIVKHEFLNGLSFGMKFGYGIEPCSKYYINGYCGDNGDIHNVTNQQTMSIPFATEQYAQYLFQNMHQKDEAQRQNTLSSTMQVVAGVGTAIAGGFSMNPTVAGAGVGVAVNGAINGMNFAKSELARSQDIRNAPPSIVSSGKVGNSEALGINKVDYISFTVHNDVKEQIGAFWHKYGYKCMQSKVPNYKNRSTFNFIQTADVKINGDVDYSDLSVLESIFNNGVTVWHNASLFRNYKYNNEVVECEQEKDEQ